MSHYPFQHSTYFTGGDPIHTSELPPMNSMEDILQDIFMRDRNTVYVAKPKMNGLKKIMNSFKNWKRGVNYSFLILPRSMRRSGFY